MPRHYDGYRRLRDVLNPLGILLTGGKHEFTRYGFREIIEKQAVDILQPDIGRAGGVSEVKKICSLASVYGLPVILHGSGAPAYHVALRSETPGFGYELNQELLEGKEPAPIW